jgi:leukotriene-A4 hydrolase
MPDPTTQSNYLQVHTTNVDLDWSLDFEYQIVEGTATHTVLAREAGVEEVMYLDPSQLLPPLGRIDITFL